jgi:hypothetical protein
MLHGCGELRRVHESARFSLREILQQLSLSGAKMAERQLLHGNARKEGPEGGGAKAQSSEGFEEKRGKEVTLNFLDLTSQVYYV